MTKHPEGEEEEGRRGGGEGERGRRRGGGGEKRKGNGCYGVVVFHSSLSLIILHPSLCLSVSLSPSWSSSLRLPVSLLPGAQRDFPGCAGSSVHLSPSGSYSHISPVGIDP
jgi:hypothetical protein